MTEPAEQRSFEIERTYDAGEDTPLPEWRGLPGVVMVGPAERRDLDAHYLDTDDAALARAGVAVRRRTGGPDEGWHVKGPKDGDGRLELRWPLSGEQPPPALLEAISRWTTAPLRPLARIQNTRHAYELRGAEGVYAEFVDDRVRATDLRGGEERSWREWEMELGPAAPANEAERTAFFLAVERAVRAAGGSPSLSDSKLARALGA